jgi:hypothetical protein
MGKALNTLLQCIAGVAYDHCDMHRLVHLHILTRAMGVLLLPWAMCCTYASSFLMIRISRDAAAHCQLRGLRPRPAATRGAPCMALSGVSARHVTDSALQRLGVTLSALNGFC